ncbi:MAG: hypothetical protein E7651_00190 [Ruminococcaceae bacterium]|nr:hypothetical protein [Oscillospiraceae bacterium]MBQ8324681.1 hypothetical protein [Clostridia bacterium]
MFGFKRKDKPPRNTDSAEFRLWMAKKLDGRSLRYILERGEDSVERVIGKGGVLSLYEGEFSVISGDKTLFVTTASELKAWEFLSLEGATLTGFDKVEGKERTILAYYKYYRD